MLAACLVRQLLLGRSALALTQAARVELVVNGRNRDCLRIVIGHNVIFLGSALVIYVCEVFKEGNVS